MARRRGALLACRAAASHFTLNIRRERTWEIGSRVNPKLVKVLLFRSILLWLSLVWYFGNIGKIIRCRLWKLNLIGDIDPNGISNVEYLERVIYFKLKQWTNEYRICSSVFVTTMKVQIEWRERQGTCSNRVHRTVIRVQENEDVEFDNE